MKYICTRDLQGGSFSVGRIQTAEEWKQTAMEWCWQDDAEELMEELEKITEEKEIIDFIREIWELEINLIGENAVELIADIKMLQLDLKDYTDSAILNAYNDGKNHAYNEIIDLIVEKGRF